MVDTGPAQNALWKFRALVKASEALAEANELDLYNMAATRAVEAKMEWLRLDALLPAHLQKRNE